MDRLIDDLTLSEGANSGRLHRPVFEDLSGFGSNPGNLRGQLFTPSSATGHDPLVVVLHGCMQTIEGYERGAGWTKLAERLGFLVLMPEQQAANNARTCFSWFQPEDITRGLGEVASIAGMIGTVIAAHGADARRVYICGLSAGGAMTAAMLATYPELFAAGAVIAGLPFGTASDVSEALDSMGRGRIKEARVWGDAVRAACSHDGPWPPIAVWHGTADKVVKPINAGELVKQWTNVHGVGSTIPEEDHIGRTTRRVWRDADGRACVTEYMVPDLGHGAPVDDADPPAPFFLPAGISATAVIARDWSLEPSRGQQVLSFLRRQFR